MVGGAGLCGCYAKTTQYLLGLLGVDTAYITGQAQGESHAWNLAWLEEVGEKSAFSSKVSPRAEDRVVTLSTCSYEFENARFVLHGVLRPEEE